jgi:HEPN domain-containing protein
MKGKPDLVRAWLRKAGSDLVAMRASARAGSLDAACFHAQQAAEKYLKAYLIDQDRAIPHTHNLYKLFALCSESDPAFRQLIDTADLLTPFAVEARYDTEFWPTSQILEQAEVAANRIARFVSPRVNSVIVKVSTVNIYEAWKTARYQFSWKADLRKFKDAPKYPGFFDRIVEPDQVKQFEDTLRAALVSDGRVERAAEVVFWKNFGPFKNKITSDLLARLNDPASWEKFAAAVKNLATNPTWVGFKNLSESCGMEHGFATPLTFLSFYDPQRFPMVDRRIGAWWSRRFPNERQFAWNPAKTVISPHKQSWAAYLAWTEFCRRQAAELSTLSEMMWRARDVEMADWSDTNAQLPLDE